ncbi:MAG: DUF4386 domain-containing protein [Thermoleophilia bacterium]|nr:DUF4386 domain-containing protein [Thermoleophilia bacterium]
MTTTSAPAPAGGDDQRTGRVAGLWYLGLALTGMASFIVIRPMVFDPDDAAATLANIRSDEWLAYLGLGLEIGIVLTQALAAVWFYKLLRPLGEVAAWAVAVFGMVNAVAIMGSSVMVGTALEVAGDASLAPAADAAATVQLLVAASMHFWGVGALFFGLWLIPMGWVAVRSGRFPSVLGWILVAGGVGYCVSAFVAYGIADAPEWLVSALQTPASVGEFWMIGYLLVKGIRPAAGIGRAVPAA